MKKVCLLVLALVLVGSFAFAEVDLSGMSYDELVALKDQINLAIWNSQEWQEVTVPVGVWKIGEDIPAGHWTITVSPDGSYKWSSVAVGTALSETGKDIDFMTTEYYYAEQIRLPGAEDYSGLDEMNYDFKDGAYVIINYGDVIFTPYAGKPSLGFK